MDLKQKWAALDPARKKKYMILFGIIGILGFAYLSSSLSSKRSFKPPKDDSIEVEVMVPKRRDATLEELSAQQMAATRKIARLESQLQSTQKILEKRIQELLGQLGTGAGRDAAYSREMQSDMEYLMNRLKRMESQLAAQNVNNQKQPMDRPVISNGSGKIEIPEMAPSGTGVPNQDNQVEIPGLENAGSSNTLPSPEAPSPMEMADEQEQVPERKRRPLRIVSGGDHFTARTSAEVASGDFSRGPEQMPDTRGGETNLPVSGGGVTTREKYDLEKEQKKPQNVYLPSGSMFQGIMITGLDAVTSGANRRNPTPVLIRVKRDAILPNYYSLQVRECFVTAGGYGDMSTERAIMRTERISCVRDDGGVIDAPLDGYITGEDGKVGMRGRLVMRQGALLTRAAIAGLLSGFAQALEPQGVTGITIGVDGNSGTTTPATRYSTSDVMSAGVLGGVSTASEKVSDYFLDMVEQIQPVIEVDAGRKATIIVVKGTNLKLG